MAPTTRNPLITAAALAAITAAAPASAQPTRGLKASGSPRLGRITGNAKRRARGWRPFGERHPDLEFTGRDQGRMDRAAAKRDRKAARRSAYAEQTTENASPVRTNGKRRRGKL